jgi:hypothetical protein
MPIRCLAGAADHRPVGMSFSQRLSSSLLRLGLDFIPPGQWEHQVTRTLPYQS